jgi:DNA-binding PadR family transcriptional regulator
LESIALTEAVYYVLLSLQSPLHGYGIMQKVENMSNGRVRLAAGTLYGAIGNMVEKGWIVAIPSDRNSRKKEYMLTDIGRDTVRKELSRLKELVANGEKLIGGWLVPYGHKTLTNNKKTCCP